MSIWKIISSDIANKLNRCGTYEVREIICTAEDLGYTHIEVEEDYDVRIFMSEEQLKEFLKQIEEK